ncbi:MAG: recombinase family protein, partial [Pseudobdellovibrionaceae bacterium]
ELVKVIFDSFLKEETLAKTAQYLNDKGLTPPRRVRGGGGPRASIFRLDQIHKLLHNKAYIGVRVFSTKDGKCAEVKAVWPAIIDVETFEKAQALLIKNRYRKRTHLDQRYPFTLSGVCFCAVCGDRMSGKSAHGQSMKVPYYEHAWATKNQASLSKKILKCEPHRILAAKIEPLVWQETKTFLLSPGTAKRLHEVALSLKQSSSEAQEADRLKRKVQALVLQIETLTERISRLPKGIDEKPFFDQLLKLQDTKHITENQLIAANNNIQSDEVISYEDFSKFTASLKALVKKADENPEIQCEIIRKITHRIEVNKNGFEIRFHAGQNYYHKELGADLAPGSLISFARPGLKQSQNQINDEKGKLIPFERSRSRSQPLPKFLKDTGSKRLTSGGPDQG